MYRLVHAAIFRGETRCYFTWPPYKNVGALLELGEAGDPRVANVTPEIRASHGKSPKERYEYLRLHDFLFSLCVPPAKTVDDSYKNIPQRGLPIFIVVDIVWAVPPSCFPAFCRGANRSWGWVSDRSIGARQQVSG